MMYFDKLQHFHGASHNLISFGKQHSNRDGFNSDIILENNIDIILKILNSCPINSIILKF